MPVPIRFFCLLQMLGLLLAQQVYGKIDFNRDIKPLLSNRCFACHGPDEGKRKAKLRLDVFDGATRDLDGY